MFAQFLGWISPLFLPISQERLLKSEDSGSKWSKWSAFSFIPAYAGGYMWVCVGVWAHGRVWMTGKMSSLLTPCQEYCFPFKRICQRKNKWFILADFPERFQWHENAVIWLAKWSDESTERKKLCKEVREKKSFGIQWGEIASDTEMAERTLSYTTNTDRNVPDRLWQSKATLVWLKFQEEPAPCTWEAVVVFLASEAILFSTRQHLICFLFGHWPY